MSKYEHLHILNVFMEMTITHALKVAVWHQMYFNFGDHAVLSSRRCGMGPSVELTGLAGEGTAAWI